MKRDMETDLHRRRRHMRLRDDTLQFDRFLVDDKQGKCRRGGWLVSSLPFRGPSCRESTSTRRHDYDQRCLHQSQGNDLIHQPQHLQEVDLQGRAVFVSLQLRLRVLLDAKPFCSSMHRS